jgi:hypothetical protein
MQMFDNTHCNITYDDQEFGGRGILQLPLMALCEQSYETKKKREQQ